MKRSGIDKFGREVTCTYRGEAYQVRDNGAVRRQHRDKKRRRPLDGVWTYGNPCAHTGYMHLSSETVHRIVATGFHGAQPSGAHVVDHIDTNRRNNRPENLRWVTRLENILSNPITARRIVIACGSIEAFLNNPACIKDSRLGSGFAWMRTVTNEEAEECRHRLINWARNDGMPKGGSLDDWVFGLDSAKDRKRKISDFVISKTKNAVQQNWRVPNEFPNCPPNTGADALSTYLANLQEGQVFGRSQFGDSIVIEAKVSKSEPALLVLCGLPKDSVKGWCLARVTIEGGLFVHESLGTFFQLDGAKKRFTLALGLTWEGGDTFDDFC